MSQYPAAPNNPLTSPLPSDLADQCQQLDEILITKGLDSRPHRSPKLGKESEALSILARMITDAPQRIVDALLQKALELCQADAAGLSVLEKAGNGEEVFRWTHLAGTLKDYVGGSTPRNHSPCGVTLDRNSPQLFLYPGRFFQYFNDLAHPIVEGLVIPLASHDPAGTLWIVSQNNLTHFDLEDVRIMSSLGAFTSSALRMMQLLDAERAARLKAEEEVASRKEMEEALRQSEEFTRRVLESSSDCVKVLDLDFHLKYMSPFGMELMEMDNFSDCEDADWRSFWREADRPAVLAAVKQALAGRTGTFHSFCPTMKGTPKWWDVTVTPIRNADGQIVKLLSSSRDVTERKQIEEERRTSHARLEKLVAERTAELCQEISARQKQEDELRELSARLLTLRDTEQRRLARDLHDSAGQLLTATTMSLASVARESTSLSPEASQALTDGTALVQETIKEIRVVSHLLHPPLLDESGLCSALREYVEGFSKRGDVKVELLISDTFGRLPETLETTIFRVVQECLTNIHRHSGCETASVEVLHLPSEIRIEVQDNGKGMPIQRSSGVGLRGMQERVGQFGGKLEIHSSPGSGTTVIARLPLTSSSVMPNA